MSPRKIVIGEIRIAFLRNCAARQQG